MSCTLVLFYYYGFSNAAGPLRSRARAGRRTRTRVFNNVAAAPIISERLMASMLLYWMLGLLLLTRIDAVDADLQQRSPAAATGSPTVPAGIPKPTARQLEWTELEIAALIHFNMASTRNC